MTDAKLAQATPAHDDAQAADSKVDTAADLQATTDTNQGETPNSGDRGGASNDDAEDYRAKWEEAQKHIKKLNEESAKHRTSAKSLKEQQDALKAEVLKAFGGDAQQSPEEALKQAQEERSKAIAELTQLKETDKLRSLVKGAGGNPDVMIPFLRGSGSLPDFGADDYDSRADEVIKETLEAQPGLRAQVAPRSSGQPLQPTGGEARINREDLSNMSAEEIVAARKAGKLDHLFKK